jgi:high-affinity nickel-transport protein
VVLRSAFSRIFNTKGFTYMAYALSGLALTIAAMESYSVITKTNILPPLTGPVLAVIIISGAFGYSFVTRNRAVPTPTLEDDPKEKTK